MKKALLLFMLVLTMGFGFYFEAPKAFAEEEMIQAESAPPAKTKEDLIQSGRLYYKARKYEAAIIEWEAALVLDPGNKKIKKYINDAKTKLEWQKKKEEKKARKDVQLIDIMSPPKEAVKILGLDECIDIAIKNSIPLTIAKKNIKLGEMRCFEARRNMLPTFTMRWEETRGTVNERYYYGKKAYMEGQQALFHGGELYFIMKQAETNLKIVKEEYDRIKNDLTLQVKKGYYTLAKTKENLKMQTALKEEVENVFDMVRKGFEGGAISKLEFLNVSSQESQVNFQFISGQGDLDVADLILKQAMNLEPRDSIDIAPNLEFKKINMDYDAILRAAFVNRPEMKINSMMVEYYKYEDRIAKAKGWPKVDLMGSWGLAREQYIAKDSGPNDPSRRMEQQWYGGFKASMPFWGSTAEYSYTREQWQPVVSAYQGTEAATQAVKIGILDNLKYYSDRESAEIDLERARQEFNKIKQDITLEARESYFSYEKALVQLETAFSKVKYQDNDLQLMKLRRGMDEALDSDVIDRMIKAAQERFGYVQALTDCHMSLATINKAIGISDYFSVDKNTNSQSETYNLLQ